MDLVAVAIGIRAVDVVHDVLDPLVLEAVEHHRPAGRDAALLGQDVSEVDQRAGFHRPQIKAVLPQTPSLPPLPLDLGLPRRPCGGRILAQELPSQGFQGAGRSGASTSCQVCVSTRISSTGRSCPARPPSARSSSSRKTSPHSHSGFAHKLPRTQSGCGYVAE